jgi:hypothetical protein
MKRSCINHFEGLPMTQYECLSLSLLATIADGIMLQLTQPTQADDSRRRRHDELVRAFRTGTEKLIDVVTNEIASNPKPTGPTS